MPRQIVVLLFLMLGLLSTAGAANPSDTLWLSDVAPKRAKASAEAGHASHDRTGKHQDNVDAAVSGEEGDNVHSGAKHLWLRQGDDPALAGYVDAAALSPEFSLVDTKGKRSRVALMPMAGLAHANFEFEEMGFYSAYLVQQSVRDGALRVRTAKAELLKGTCCQKDVEEEAAKAVIDATAPLELVREHGADEKLFTRIFSGDKVSFLVLSQGKPLADVPVTMITQMGWRKTAASGPDGRVTFTMIRDYFPPWLEFKKRYKEAFLMVAEHEVAQTGEHAGEKYTAVRYQTTLAGKYMPSPHDYRSYAWGLGIGLGVTVLGGLAVYLYRRRRLKPFKEVRLDEKA